MIKAFFAISLHKIRVVAGIIAIRDVEINVTFLRCVSIRDVKFHLRLMCAWSGFVA
jgi:hypothetical protein